MGDAGARLGHRPVGFHVAAGIGQGGRGDGDAMGLGIDGIGERLGRVDPMAEHPGVDIAAVDSVHGEPVDENIRCLGLEGAEHVDPPGNQHFTAPGQSPANRLDAGARRAVEFVGVHVEAAAQAVAQLQQGTHQSGER